LGRDILNLRGRKYQNDQQVGVPRGIGRALGRLAACCGQAPDSGGIEVVAADGKARLEKVPRLPFTHGAEPDESNPLSSHDPSFPPNESWASDSLSSLAALAD
jgi:hypothetical protein